MKFPLLFRTTHRSSMPEIAERLARFQTAQVEANPDWFAKYEDFCGAKGLEAVRATPGFAKLYQTIRGLFFTLLDPTHPIDDVAVRMAETHQRIGVRFAWFLAACQNIEDEMHKLGLEPLFINRLRSFTRSVAERYEQIFEHARADALKNTEHLNALLEKIMSVANGVSQSAHELSNGQRELSKRVEHDAASVEEISAAVEEVGTSFKTMTTNANETSRVAQDMTQAVGNVRDVMADVVELMGQVSTQAHGMRKILNTITEVAFQTNMLSLNASVEAARIGSMGGGFSVIAKEIRKLSDKVATEAHSIDDWINTLGEGAQKGQDAVLKAADDINRIAESSGQVLARMKDTAVAIRDTENSFSQVQEAIMSIDQGLQKTAAMVEEISTAADTLLMEAEHLMNAAGMNKENLPLSAPTQHELQKPSEKTRRLPRQERLSSSDWEQF